ncbi:hypothetical protein MKZ38_007001 [Zalerion maritima]|uniref:Uncharacterized protein n=1 Tax=Zalerion maritima TaxID=339359 RepID=A0AAD5RJD1_9PEZI|nr:hypothetical protein MKZ38_007001 [Zalerion maritima]
MKLLTILSLTASLLTASVSGAAAPPPVPTVVPPPPSPHPRLRGQTTFHADHTTNGHKYHFEMILDGADSTVVSSLNFRFDEVRNERPNPSRLGPGECTKDM